jgi:cardiolipin synthase (CMP-forming)
MTLPNLLTLLRVLLIPVFIILIINRSFGWAIVTFAVAGITDGIDGLLARLTHQRTELGAYLDPIADKLLLASSFITLALIELVPSWLAVIVISRDVIILVGIAVLMLNDYRPQIRPSLVSKATTFLQISTILLVLAERYYPILKGPTWVVIYGAGLFTVLSGAHYIHRGARILNGKAEDCVL